MTCDTTHLQVDVIVRTLAEKKRAVSLRWALDSVRNQAGVNARALVIINGDRFDPGLVAELEQTPDIKVDRIEQASLVASRTRGLALVDAPIFTFLDDDDVLVVDSLAGPVGWLVDHPQDDVVITLTDMSSRGEQRLTGHRDTAQRPLYNMLDSCWLCAGSGFFRTSEEMKELVDVKRGHMEWTTIALRLIRRSTRLHFMDMATVIYHDTDASLSKNAAHQETELAVLREIMDLETTDRHIRRRARIKYLNTLHTLSTTYQNQGRRLDAWRMHLRSLCSGAFFKYLLYTRKLFR